MQKQFKCMSSSYRVEKAGAHMARGALGDCAAGEIRQNTEIDVHGASLLQARRVQAESMSDENQRRA